MSFNEYDDSSADDLFLESMLVDGDCEEDCSEDCDDVDVVISDDSAVFAFVNDDAAGGVDGEGGIDGKGSAGCAGDAPCDGDMRDVARDAVRCAASDDGCDLFGVPVVASSASGLFDDLFDGGNACVNNGLVNDGGRSGAMVGLGGRIDDLRSDDLRGDDWRSDANMESVSKSALASLRRGSSSGVVIGGCSDLFCNYFMDYCRDSSLQSGVGSGSGSGSFSGGSSVGVSAFKRLRDKFVCIDFADDNSDEFAGQIGLSGCDGFFDEGDEPTPFVDSLMLAVSRKGCVVVLHNMESFLCNKNAEECIKRAIDECAENGNKMVMMFNKKFNANNIKLPDLRSRIGDFYKLAL